MYTLPLDDDTAVAIDDADEDAWFVHLVDFEARTIDRFEVMGLGKVQTLRYDAGRRLIWVIIEGTLFAITLSDRELFEVGMPEDGFFAYDMTGEGEATFVCGEYSNLWRLELPALEWTPVMKPEPKPPAPDDPAARTRLNQDYARRHPPFLTAFTSGGIHYFAGALGTIARLRDGRVETTEVDDGARFVSGNGAPGGDIVLSSDNPGAAIYRGAFDDGFEILFTDDLRALHRTAIQDGVRFVGVAEYPVSDVHNLYTLDEDGLTDHMTDCAREPMPLVSLTSTGASLWAVDTAGVFRRAEGRWTLLDAENLARGAFPEA